MAVQDQSRARAIKITLRRHAPSDFETLYEIDQACYEPAIAYSRRELRNYLRFPGAECIVAEAKENAERKIVGFIVAAHENYWGYIITIDVVSAYRRRGVGSMMLEEIERRLAASGVREVALETATDNASAIAFWERHGYRKRGLKKDYYPNHRDAFAMTKRLT